MKPIHFPPSKKLLFKDKAYFGDPELGINNSYLSRSTACLSGMQSTPIIWTRQVLHFHFLGWYVYGQIYLWVFLHDYLQWACSFPHLNWLEEVGLMFCYIEIYINPEGSYWIMWVCFMMVLSLVDCTEETWGIKESLFPTIKYLLFPLSLSHSTIIVFI